MNIDISPRGAGKTTRAIEWLKKNLDKRVLITYSHEEENRLKRLYPGGYTECGECKDLHRNKNITRCQKCSSYRCMRHIYFRPDESNIAITRNAPKLCIDCYKESYQI